MRTLLVFAVVFRSSCQSADEPPDSAAELSQVAYADIEASQGELSASGVAAMAPAIAPAPASPDRSASAAATPSATASAAEQTATRLFVRTARLGIRVGDYEAARRKVGVTARRMGALVAGESEQRLPDEISNTLTIRVDAARFDTLLDALAAVGEEVTDRNVTVDDVTEQSADLESRLRARRAVAARYEAILGRTGSIDDVLAVEQRLGETREQIEIAEGQLRGLRDRVALSTITLTIAEPLPGRVVERPTGPGVAARLGAAFESGWDALLGLAVGLVALWPLALLVPVGVLAWRRLQSARARARVEAE